MDWWDGHFVPPAPPAPEPSWASRNLPRFSGMLLIGGVVVGSYLGRF